MKFLPLLALLGLTMASAIPTTSNEDCDCPVNGTLPEEGSYVSTSAFYEISAKKPNKHYPPSLTAKVTPGDLCFITNLELPTTAVGKTCTLKFLFPTKEQAKQWYKFSGPGHFTFTGYATGVGADDTTTYNNQPAPGPSKCSVLLFPSRETDRLPKALPVLLRSSPITPTPSSPVLAAFRILPLRPLSAAACAVPILCSSSLKALDLVAHWDSSSRFRRWKMRKKSSGCGTLLFASR